MKERGEVPAVGRGADAGDEDRGGHGPAAAGPRGEARGREREDAGEGPRNRSRLLSVFYAILVIMHQYFTRS